VIIGDELLLVLIFLFELLAQLADIKAIINIRGKRLIHILLLKSLMKKVTANGFNRKNAIKAK
jgi:hypothetical protein